MNPLKSTFLLTLAFVRCCAIIFMRNSSVLAIAVLSDCPSVTRVDQSKTVQARVTKFSSSAARKTLVSGTVKLFHKFEWGHPKRGR